MSSHRAAHRHKRMGAQSKFLTQIGIAGNSLPE